MHTIANAQVWHRWLGHLHAQSLDILRKQDGTGITFEGAVLDYDVCAVGKLNSLLTPRQPTTRSTSLSSCTTGGLHASGHRRLQIHQQDNRRVHQVDRRLLVDQQQPTSSVASTVRRFGGHPLRRPHHLLACRQGRRVHWGGVWAILLGDRYYLRVRRHQHTAENQRFRALRENSMCHGSVRARRQQFLLVHVRGAVHGGGVPQEQDSA